MGEEDRASGVEWSGGAKGGFISSKESSPHIEYFNHSAYELHEAKASTQNLIKFRHYIDLNSPK